MVMFLIRDFIEARVFDHMYSRARWFKLLSLWMKSLSMSTHYKAIESYLSPFILFPMRFCYSFNLFLS